MTQIVAPRVVALVARAARMIALLGICGICAVIAIVGFIPGCDRVVDLTPFYDGQPPPDSAFGPAVTIQRESGLKRASLTVPLWPRSTWRRVPVLASKTIAS